MFTQKQELIIDVTRDLLPSPSGTFLDEGTCGSYVTDQLKKSFLYGKLPTKLERPEERSKECVVRYLRHFLFKF